MITPERAVDAMHEVFGRHPGYRALHAKGTLCRGRFTPTAEAARLTRAAHMQGQPVDVTVRLSNGSGDPGSPDYEADVRGLATTFHLPDGSRTDIVAQTSPHFPVRTPEDFVELVHASQPGLARVWRFPIFLARHPRVLSGLRLASKGVITPPSYASCHYYAIHAYRWIDAAGDGCYVRYRWLPVASEAAISRREARGRGPDYLQQEIRERIARGPAEFTLELQLASERDSVDDPTAAWPDERETVTAGVLQVTGVANGGEDDGERTLVFDPARVTEGIELSDDQILRFRPRAYSVSAERRASGG